MSNDVGRPSMSAKTFKVFPRDQLMEGSVSLTLVTDGKPALLNVRIPSFIPLSSPGPVGLRVHRLRSSELPTMASFTFVIIQLDVESEMVVSLLQCSVLVVSPLGNVMDAGTNDMELLPW